MTGVFHDIKRYTGHTSQLYCSPTHLIKSNISHLLSSSSSTSSSTSTQSTFETQSECNNNNNNNECERVSKRQKIDENNNNDNLKKDVLISGSDDGKVK